MIYRAIAGMVAAFSAFIVFAAQTGATAQGAPIRDLQYTNYLKDNEFNSAAIASACNSPALPGISFRSSADEKNLTAFLSFLKIRPQEIRIFNNGQFSQTVEALSDAVADVCRNTARHGDGDEADALFKPLTSFDPLIDDINLSDFLFEYRFQHDQPSGYLPLTRRAFPVMQLKVDYDDDNFPDSTGGLWTYQTAELIVTINNYEHFRLPESGFPGAIRQENGSYPCYYTDPNFNAVYRFALRDCNPDTLIDEAPPGTSLREAVREVVANFIEQNIDVAGAPVRVDDFEDAEVCCVTRRPGVSDQYFMTEINQCLAPDGGPGEVAAARFCGVDFEDEAAPIPGDFEADDDIGYPRGPRGRVCCHDNSGINPNDPASFFWEEESWCRSLDRHEVVSPSECRQ